MVAANIMCAAEALRIGSTIADARKILKDAEAAPVVDGEGRLVGQIEAYDLLKGLAVPDRPLGLLEGVSGIEMGKVEDLMDRSFACVGPEAEASAVMALLEGKKALSVFVVDDGMRLLGRITPKDMLERIWEYRERKGP